MYVCATLSTFAWIIYKFLFYVKKIFNTPGKFAHWSEFSREPLNSHRSSSESFNMIQRRSILRNVTGKRIGSRSPFRISRTIYLRWSHFFARNESRRDIFLPHSVFSITNFVLPTDRCVSPRRILHWCRQYLLESGGFVMFPRWIVTLTPLQSP